MADICVPPDCLNGYDCYWLFFCLFTGINTKTTIISTIWCYTVIFSVVYTVIQLLLLYISLYLYYIWYRFSYLCKSILPFKEMAKLVIAVVYTVIYSYLVILLLYIYLIYLYLIIETLFTPPSQLSSIFL